MNHFWVWFFQYETGVKIQDTIRRGQVQTSLPVARTTVNLLSGGVARISRALLRSVRKIPACRMSYRHARLLVLLGNRGQSARFYQVWLVIKWEIFSI